MTQYDPTVQPDDDDDDTPDPEDPAGIRRRLRQTDKALKAANAQLAEYGNLRKENAFLKVGLPDTPVARLYRDTYNADDLSEETIRAGAIELGIFQAESDATQAEVNGLAGQSSALIGSQPPMAPDSQEAMWKEFNEFVSKGGNGEEVLRRYGVTVASDER